MKVEAYPAWLARGITQRVNDAREGPNPAPNSGVGWIVYGTDQGPVRYKEVGITDTAQERQTHDKTITGRFSSVF
jgi:hypothetical protein